MKLFTKDIDKKLFAQFEKGSDLESQMVVAKIFNPYGRGVWYILNSDPSDPDYLWAIVDLFDVEAGSVSRSELESIKVPPFRLPLERDMYFEPINAAELYRGLRAGKTYAEGGEISIEAQNKDMLINYAEELEHHIKEFEEAAKGAEKVMPWVIAKIERASTDLSDVTHYLASENEKRREYGDGEGEEEYANGGEVKWENAHYGDNALVVSENKMGVIIKPYGRKFHLKFADGTEKTYDASELKFIKDEEYASGGMMAKGGEISSWDNFSSIPISLSKHDVISVNGEEWVLTKIESSEYGIRHYFVGIDKKNKGQDKFLLQDYGSGSILEIKDFADGGMMAKGGMVNRDLNMKVKQLAEKKGFVPQKLGRDYELNMAQAVVSALGDANFHSEAKKLVSALEREPWSDDLYKSEYYNAEDVIDEFGREVARLSGWDGSDIADAFIYILKMNGQQRLAMMIDKAMEDDSQMASGGMMAKGGKTEADETVYIEYFNKAKKFAKDRKEFKGETAYKDAISWGRKNIPNFNADMVKFKMADGGMMAVAAVKKSLLERKKVPKAVQRDYGKTFTPTEAEDSAKRIVGAQTARERLQMRIKRGKK